MSANVMASLLLASHALPNRPPRAAHSETPGSGGGFDSLLADFDQRSATLSAPAGETGALSAAQRATPTPGPESPATSSAKLAANVDAALSLLGTVAFIAPTPILSSPSTQPLAAAATPRSTNPASPVAAEPSSTLTAPSAPEKFAAIAAALDTPTPSAVAGPPDANANVKVPDPDPASALAPATPGAALGTIAYATTTALAFAPELGFQSLRTKTYLSVSSVENAALAGLQGQGQGRGDFVAAATNAAPVAPASPRGRASVSGDAAAPATLPGQGEVEAAAALAAPLAPANPQGGPFASRKTPTPAGLPAAANGEAATSPLAVAADATPRAQANLRYEQSSSRNPGREDSGPVGPHIGAAPTTEAAPAIAVPVAASPTSDNAKIVNLADLGDRLVNEAQTLAQPNARTNSPPAAGPLKQLQLNLAPASLGAVAVKLKLSNGKLSVDVGVANPNALAAVESQRDAIVSKLQAGAQPLESFVVHQQAFSEAPLAQSGSNASQTGSFGNASGNDSSPQDARDQAPRPPRAPPTPNVAPPRNSRRGDLVV